MNRPSVMVRLAGAPRIAVLLWIGCAVVVAGWYEAHAPWWQALIAVAIAKRTLSAMGQLRRYKQWAAEWNAMGAPDDRPAPVRQAQRAAPHTGVGSRVLVGVAALIAVCLPFSGAGSSDGVICLWLAACLFLGWKVVGAVRRKGGGSGKVMSQRGKAEADGDDMVGWLLPRATSSPSRMDAMRNLPEYSARLIGK